MALAERTARRFAHRREGFGQQGVERLAFFQPRPEFAGFALQGFIVELFDLRLEGIYLTHFGHETPHGTVIGGAEDFARKRKHVLSAVAGRNG